MMGRAAALANVPKQTGQRCVRALAPIILSITASVKQLIHHDTDTTDGDVAGASATTTAPPPVMHTEPTPQHPFLYSSSRSHFLPSFDTKRLARATRMHVLSALRSVALVLAFATLLCNWPYFGKYYERVGHVYVRASMWACLGVVRLWTVCAAGYFAYILSSRPRRPRAHTEVATLMALGVVGCTAAGAVTGAGFFSVAQCAQYDGDCTRALVGGMLIWVMSLYLIGFSAFRLRHAVSWREAASAPLGRGGDLRLTSILEESDESDESDGTDGPYDARTDYSPRKGPPDDLGLDGERYSDDPYGVDSEEPTPLLGLFHGDHPSPAFVSDQPVTSPV